MGTDTLLSRRRKGRTGAIETIARSMGIDPSVAWIILSPEGDRADTIDITDLDPAKTRGSKAVIPLIRDRVARSGTTGREKARRGRPGTEAPRRLVGMTDTAIAKAKLEVPEPHWLSPQPSRTSRHSVHSFLHIPLNCVDSRTRYPRCI